MDAKELRIGNWMNLNFGIPVQLVGLERMDNGHIPVVEDSKKEWKVSFMVLSPIPLTPEILLACGFKMIAAYNNRDWFHTYKLDGIYISICRRATEGMEANTIFLSLPNSKQPILTSLHQLQNLYFALTGTELQYQSTQLNKT